MKSLFTLIIIFTAIEIKAQDTIWFDVSNEVTIKSNAWYYKLTNYTKTNNGEYFCEKFWINNTIKARFTCSDEKLQDFNDSYISWYDNGQVEDSGIYVLDKKHGTWKYYFPNGQLSGIVDYKDDKRVEEKYWDIDGKQVKDNKEANTITEFIGGFKNLSKYLSKNIKYPTIARKNGIQGKVIVSFVIDEKGNVINPHIRKSVNPDLDKEALRVITEMPRWKPGKSYNRYSKIRFIFPVNFEL